MVYLATLEPTTETGRPRVTTIKHSDPEVQRILEVNHEVQEPLATLPPHRDLEFSIEVQPGAKPAVGPPLRVPMHLQPELEKQLRDLEAKGFIYPTQSDYAASVLFVPKKNGKLRMCVDFRALNRITVKNRWPLPRIDELLDKLKHARFFSKLDLASGYHQMRINDADQHKTAFIAAGQQFAWRVLPFGLSNAPSQFMQLMLHCLGDLVGKFCLVYLDDILIFSNSRQDHLLHLNAVLQRLNHHGLRIQQDKCEFMQRSINFLGHVVSHNRICMDRQKVIAISNWPAPKNLNELRAFLGLAGYYRRFVKDFSKVALPLTDLLRADSPWHWNQEQQSAFASLKTEVEAAPALKIPEPNRPFILHCDASDFAIGGVLSQEEPSGAEHPIAFLSSKLSPAELNYSTPEKELLSIVQCCREWRHYLEGAPAVKLRTDHRAWTHLLTMKAHTSKRTMRWLELIQSVLPEIEHISGASNVVADALSRRADHADTRIEYLDLISVAEEPDLPIELNLVHHEVSESHFQLAETFVQDIQEAYTQDEQCRHLIEKLQQDPEGHSEFSLIDGLLYTRRSKRLVIPYDDRIKRLILSEVHDQRLHPGITKTMHLVKQRFFWPELASDVYAHVAGCLVCQRTKFSVQRQPGMLHPLPIPSRPFEHVHLDFMSNLPVSNGYDSVLILVDRFSKFAYFLPCTTTITAQETAELLLRNVFCTHDLPKIIISDRDPRFISETWKSLWQRLGSRIQLTTAYHQSANGQAEKTVQILQTMLRGVISPSDLDWSEWLYVAQRAYNTNMQESTRLTPHEVLFCRKPTLAIDWLLPASSEASAEDQIPARMKHYTSLARENLEKAQLRQKEQADLHRREVVFQAGDKAWVSFETKRTSQTANRLATKFRPVFSGPFTVLERLENDNYRLALPSNARMHPVFHVSKLRKFVQDRWCSDTPILPQSTEAWEIEAIIGMHKHKRRVNGGRYERHFLVKWKGEDEPSWEPEGNLRNAQELLTDYLKRMK